jgi:glycosyltransferase involved in cell wall biosynthesis
MIEKVIEDNEFRERTISYGIERVKLFSWENTAKELIKLYNSLKY